MQTTVIEQQENNLKKRKLIENEIDKEEKEYTETEL